jgi:hypothetical protein
MSPTTHLNICHSPSHHKYWFSKLVVWQVLYPMASALYGCAGTCNKYYYYYKKITCDSFMFLVPFICVGLNTTVCVHACMWSCRFPYHFEQVEELLLLLNVHWVSDIRQTGIYTAESLVPQPTPFENEMLLLSWKSINWQVVIKFWQNLSKQELKHYGLRSRDSLILFGVRKNCLISEESPLLYQFTRRVIKSSTVVIIKEYHSYGLNTKFYPIPFTQG